MGMFEFSLGSPVHRSKSESGSSQATAATLGRGTSFLNFDKALVDPLDDVVPQLV